MEEIQLLWMGPYNYRLRTFNADGQRFEALFRQCWDRLPAEDRQTILSHWQKLLYPQGPTFELSSFWHDSKHSYAQVKGQGYEMRFDDQSFRILPEQVGMFIIAHEFAHVFRWASGRRQREEPEDVGENEADAIASQWGFDKAVRNLFQHLVNIDGFEKACRSIAGRM